MADLSLPNIQGRPEVFPPRQGISAPSCLTGSLLIESGYVATLVSMGGEDRTCVGLLGRGSLIGAREGAGGLRWSYFTLSEVAVRLIPADAHLLSAARVQAQDSLCISQLALVAVCNARHNLAERCAQWLLRFAHHLGSTIQITHAFLAEIIGVRRSGISTVLHAWQQEGVITQGHGQVTIVDRESLQQKACSCPMIAARVDSAVSDGLLQADRVTLASRTDLIRDDQPVHPNVAVARQLRIQLAEKWAKHLALQRTTSALMHGMVEGVTTMQGELQEANRVFFGSRVPLSAGGGNRGTSFSGDRC